MSKSNSYNPYQDTYIYYSDGRKELIKGEKSNLGICKKCNKEVLKIENKTFYFPYFFPPIF